MNVEAHPPPHWPRIFSGDPGRLRWIALILYVLFLNLWGLGRHGLFEPDEGRYANMALEFLEPEHDRLEPTLSDVSHFDKPPLIYWMTGTSLAVFGVNEFAARLPSVVGSFLGLAGVAPAYRQSSGASSGSPESPCSHFDFTGKRPPGGACWFSPRRSSVGPSHGCFLQTCFFAGCAPWGRVVVSEEFPVLDSAGGAPVRSCGVWPGGTRRRPASCRSSRSPWPCISRVDKTFWRGCVRSASFSRF